MPTLHNREKVDHLSVKDLTLIVDFLLITQQTLVNMALTVERNYPCANVIQRLTADAGQCADVRARIYVHLASRLGQVP